jgi:hypothetical protein
MFARIARSDAHLSHGALQKARNIVMGQPMQSALAHTIYSI